MTLNCLIVDDEPLALDLLESYVSRTPFLHLVAQCDSAVKALSVIEEEPIDLVFLDIQMPELNGLELSRLVGNKVKIIFTTAFEQYALEGFRVDALDYLLKPFNYTEFLRAATKALRWSEMSRVENVSANVPDSIFVKSDYKLIQIQLKDILYIEGLKDYIRIQTSYRLREQHHRLAKRYKLLAKRIHIIFANKETYHASRIRNCGCHFSHSLSSVAYFVLFLCA